MTDKNINVKDAELLQMYRNKLFEIDKELILLFGERIELTNKIGKVKFNNNLDIEQSEFWSESSAFRKKTSEQINLSTGYIEELFAIIRKESIRNQILEVSKDDK